MNALKPVILPKNLDNKLESELMLAQAEAAIRENMKTIEDIIRELEKRL